MKITKATRVFKFKELVLEDPNITMTVGQVKDFYSNEYPELVNATTTEKKTDGGIEYTFDVAIGKKG